MTAFVLARQTFREVIRDRILYLIVVFAALLIGASLLLSSLALGETERITRDLAFGAIALFGLVVTLFSGTSLLHREVERGTVRVILAKPVDRSAFIIGKHLGLSGVLALLLALMTLVFVGMAYGAGMPVGWQVVPVVFGIWVEWVVLIAFALLFSTFASPMMSAAYTLAMFVVGHLTKDLLSLGSLAGSEAIGRITRLAYYLLPDLERLNLKNHFFGTAPPEWNLFANSVLYAFMYAGALLVLACAVFAQKEF